MNPRVIVIDGKTYHSVEEMPPEIRQKYEQAMQSLGDANQNKIPDVFESMNIFADKNGNGVPDLVENLVAGQATLNSMKIIIDGKEFDGIEGLPPEARARYEQAMSKLDANKNGIPDFIEGRMAANAPSVAVSPNFGIETPSRSTPLSVSPSTVQTPDTSTGWMLMLGGSFMILLCVAGAAGVWYFFLR